MRDAVCKGLDAVCVGMIAGTIAGLLPVVATFLAIVWYGIQITDWIRKQRKDK